jgi:hypothetical protein
MWSVLRLSVVVVLGFGPAGLLGLCLSMGPGLPPLERAGTELRSELVSAASQAIPTAELRLPFEQGKLRHVGFSDPGRHAPAARASVSSDGGLRNHGLADRRPMIRLICRGARVPHSSDEPPEQPRSLC